MYGYTINCQRTVLTWLTFSFINYFGFIGLVFGLICASRTDTPRSKRISFRMGVFMFFLFVPFMGIWNLYGNLMIKSEYFKVGGVDTTEDIYNYEDENQNLQ